MDGEKVGERNRPASKSRSTRTAALVTINGAFSATKFTAAAAVASAAAAAAASAVNAAPIAAAASAAIVVQKRGAGCEC